MKHGYSEKYCHTHTGYLSGTDTHTNRAACVSGIQNAHQVLFIHSLAVRYSMGTSWVHREYTKLWDIGEDTFNLLESSHLLANPLLDVAEKKDILFNDEFNGSEN